MSSLEYPLPGKFDKTWTTAPEHHFFLQAAAEKPSYNSRYVSRLYCEMNQAGLAEIIPPSCIRPKLMLVVVIPRCHYCCEPPRPRTGCMLQMKEARCCTSSIHQATKRCTPQEPIVIWIKGRLSRSPPAVVSGLCRICIVWLEFSARRRIG